MLINVIDEMRIASGLPMPKVFIIESDAMNAFATGRDPEHAVVAVTRGLLKNLNREELQGVIGHEISHIYNYDIRYMMVVAATVGCGRAVVRCVFGQCALWRMVLEPPPQKSWADGGARAYTRDLRSHLRGVPANVYQPQP